MHVVGHFELSLDARENSHFMAERQLQQEPKFGVLSTLTFHQLREMFRPPRFYEQHKSFQGMTFSHATLLSSRLVNDHCIVWCTEGAEVEWLLQTPITDDCLDVEGGW